MKITGRSISMIRGDSESIIVSCSDSNGKINFTTGDKVYMTVKESINTEQKVFQKLVEEFVDGNAVIEIDPDDTKGLRYGAYVYDVQIVMASGKVTTIIPPSDFTILGEVTYE